MKTRVWVGALAVVVAGAAVCWFLSSDEERPAKTETRKKSMRIATVVPKTAAVARVSRPIGRQSHPVRTNVQQRLSSIDDRDLRPPEGGYYTNRQGQLCYFNADRNPYTNGVEQLLNMVIPSEPGASVPPLPIISGDQMEELKRALKHKLTVTEDDDEATIERKMLITQGKLEMEEQSSGNGMTVSEYVNALRDQYNDNAAYLAEAQEIDQRIYEDESMTDEDYAKAREQINAKLKERGLPELEARE